MIDLEEMEEGEISEQLPIANHHRKRSRNKKKQLNWNQLEQESLLRRALPLETNGENVLPNGCPPMTGMQYLLQVRQEASQCPHVMVAQNLEIEEDDKRLFHEIKQWGLQESVIPEMDTNEMKLLPCQAWLEGFVPEFERLQESWTRYFRDRGSSTTLSFVKPRDERGWKELLYPADTTKSGLVPELQVMVHIDQTNALRLLKYHTLWILDSGISQEESAWIFCLLVRLDPLLTSDQTCIIRDLCRKCKSIRTHLAKNTPETFSQQVAGLNMIIAIISTVFGQKDLQDAFRSTE